MRIFSHFDQPGFMRLGYTGRIQLRATSSDAAELDHSISRETESVSDYRNAFVVSGQGRALCGGFSRTLVAEVILISTLSSISSRGNDNRLTDGNLIPPPAASPGGQP